MSLGGLPPALIGAVDDWLTKQKPQIGAVQPTPPQPTPVQPHIGAAPPTAAPQPSLRPAGPMGGSGMLPGGTEQVGAPVQQAAPAGTPQIGAPVTPDYAKEYHDWAATRPPDLAPDAGKPSMIRKIGGIALGTAIGALNPKGGAEVGESIINAPRHGLELEQQQKEQAWERKGATLKTEAGLADTGSQINERDATAAKLRSDVATAGQPKPKEEEWTVVSGAHGPNGEPIQEEKNSGQMRFAPLAGAEMNDKTPVPKNMEAKTLKLPSGQQVAGKVDSQGNLLLADGTAAPKGTILYQQPNYGQLVLPTKTEDLLENGIPTKMGWDAKTQKYDIPQGQAATGAYAHEEAQAGAVQRAGNDLITDIKNNRKSLGNVKAIVNSAFLGTPLDDPKAKSLAVKLASYAALNPAMHGAKGMQAIKAFEQMVGGIPDNPDALIAAIQGISQTAGAINPNLSGGESGASGAPPPGANIISLDDFLKQK